MELKASNAKITEVRDVIHGSIPLYPWELAILDSQAFQRLRNIKQLGFSEFAYPCAVHNRYIHSLGVAHLAGVSFHSIFRKHQFSSPEVAERFYFLTRISAMLHDIGHGPFSHAIEHAMPAASSLQLPAEVLGKNVKRQATHEDYTLKILLESSLTPILEKEYARFGITPWDIACMMSLDLKERGNLFHDKKINYRHVLHQIISSEVDADRMDYLQRDSYYSGVSYGTFDYNWLLSNLGLHIADGKAYLALSDRAIYTFEDFLLSRYHMFLMVYLHHKSVGYEEMMKRYLNSPDCSFSVPSDIEAYIHCDDSIFYSFLRLDADKNEWAQRILSHRTFKVALELHDSKKDPKNDPRTKELVATLESKKIPYFVTSSGKGLSNYVKPNLGANDTKETTIFVESNDRLNEPSFVPIENFTDLFRRYGETKNILRVYVPENTGVSKLGS